MPLPVSHNPQIRTLECNAHLGHLRIDLHKGHGQSSDNYCMQEGLAQHTWPEFAVDPTSIICVKDDPQVLAEQDKLCQARRALHPRREQFVKW